MAGGHLRAGFLNVTSLRAHIEKIRELLHGGSRYHLFGVAESRLDSVVGMHRWLHSRQNAEKGLIRRLYTPILSKMPRRT